MSNHELLELIRNSKEYLNLKSPRDEKVIESLSKVDRKEFVPPDVYNYGFSAYDDLPLEIGYGQTCSAPSMVALMTDLLGLEQGMKVLEVGTGCGYHAAVVSNLVGLDGMVVSIEIIPELKILGESNLRKYFKEEYEQRFRLVQGDGSIGFPEESPFDRIYLTAGISSEFDPFILAEQLKQKGKLLFPERMGELILQAYENKELIDEKRFYGVAFVWLKGENA